MSRTKPVYGNHVGIVVNQDDPENRGRVQVFVPYLTNTIYKGWNETLTSKKFKNIGGGGDLTPEIVDSLKEVLPWAECAAPIFGGGTSASHNPYTKNTSVNPYHKTSNGSNNTVASSNVNPLSDSSINGIVNKAQSILGAGRSLNFGNYVAPGKFVDLNGNTQPGGRCATAVSCLAGAMYDIPEAGEKKLGSTGDGWASAVANGSNKYFSTFTDQQGQRLFEDPVPVGKGYQLQPGEILAMQGGKVRSGGVQYGHIIMGVGVDANGKTLSMSDDVTDDYTRYLDGGSSYHSPVVIRPTEAGRARLNTVTGLNSKGGDGNVGSNTIGAPVSPNAATAAGVAGAVVNPDDTATDSTQEVKSIATNDGVQALNIPITVKRTNYGLSAAVKEGGDEIGDKWTDRGYSSTGQNLTPGVVAVANKADIGTVYRDSDGYAYIAADLHGHPEGSKVIDFYQDTYKATKSDVNLTIVGKVDKVSKNPEGIKEQLSLYGKVPEGQSARDWLAQNNKGKIDVTQDGYYPVKNPNVSNSLTSPYPNFNAGNTSSHYEGPQSSGMFSIPKPGAKVFVFFLAGDIQKPIYFANVLEPDSIKQALQVAGSYGKEHDNARETIHTDSINNGSAKITMTSNQGYVADGIPKDETNIEMGANGTGCKFTAGAAVYNSGGDTTTNTMGGKYENVSGPKSSHTGPSFKEIDGDAIIKVGKFDEAQLKAAENLSKLLKQTQKEKVESIKKEAPSGQKVPCPVCSVSYPVDKASAFAKRVFSLIRRLGTVPWFSFSIDVLEFITGLVMIPFFLILPAGKINGGSCGNPDCKDGKLPSPQKAIENANRAYSEKLKQKQNEIAKYEQQMGNGGTHSVAAAKDVVISAGLVLDDQDAFVEVGKTSHGCHVTPAKDARGTLIANATGVKQMVHTEPMPIPGGNITLRGGSKIKFVSGAQGMSLETKGKISIGGGQVEIISGEGSLMLTSPTMTTLKGNGVKIEANDRSGDGGGVVIDAKQTKVKGLGVTGNLMLMGGLNMKGELSSTYLNTVGERTQTASAGPCDQKVDFATWGVGPLQTNNILNTLRTALMYFAMPGALFNISGIVKLFQQLYNSLYTMTVIEPITTGIGIGLFYVQLWNWQHNQMNEPEEHTHEYTRPRGTYYDHESGVHQSACDGSDVPTPARKKGSGLDGGPKTLAGCGGFGFGGGRGGLKGSKYPFSKLNSFGLATEGVPGFTGTRLSDNNIRFEYNPDGTVKPVIITKSC